MPIHVFKSTDTGAPSLSGTAGDLVNLLDKLLVDGYNQQTGVTATQTGGTATYSKTSHGYVAGQVLAVTAFTSTEYNVTGKVLTVPDANSWTMEVDSGAPGTAVGTGTTIVAPLGWTTAYTATNKRAYRQPGGTNQFYLRVVDDGTGSASYARVVGYETMSDIDTGTGAFPTAAQMSGGLYAHKSSAASATARVWRCFSDGKFFHLHHKVDGTWWMRVLRFGDFQRLVDTDLFNTLIDANNNSGYNSGSVAGFEMPTNTFGSSAAFAAGGSYAARSYTGTGTAVIIGSQTPLSSSALNGGAVQAYPAPILGGIVMTPVFITENGAGPRGIVPGLWSTPHNFNNSYGSDLDTWSGALGSELEGRYFELQKAGWSGQSPIFESSNDNNTWGV